MDWRENFFIKLFIATIMDYLLKKTEETIAKDIYLYEVYKAMCNLRDNNDTALINTKFDKDFIYERNYVLSMVYQLGLSNNPSGNNFVSGAFVNGEVIKRLNIKEGQTGKVFNKLVSLRPKPKGKKEKKDNRNKKAEYANVMPDFLIHTSHNTTFTRNDQLLIVEVKTTCDLKKEEFFWDFFKLNVYLDQLLYQNAIYIILNTSVDIIDDFLTEYIKKIKYTSEEICNRLWFFVQEDIKKEIQIFKFRK